MGGSTSVLLIEVLVVAAFFVVAVVGFKRSLWVVIAGLAAHGVFDFFHGSLVANPGVPYWWPPFCLAFDVTLAVCVAWLLHIRKRALLPSPISEYQ